MEKLIAIAVSLMQKKSEAHDTLSMIFKCDGVTPKMVVQNSKGKSLGEFSRKCRETDCRLVNNELFLTWSQIAEDCIR